MQPHRYNQSKLRRIARSLHLHGVDVSYHQGVWSLTRGAGAAELLLPDSLPLERKAVFQLLALADVQHPAGGRVCRCVATPDFHPGDSGIAIGSVVATQGMVIPAAVGRDINCGMRLHVADLAPDVFARGRARLVSLLKQDYLLGTRDITLHRRTVSAALTEGLMGWLTAGAERRGTFARVDAEQIERELDRVYESGSLPGSADWIPDAYTGREWLRDQALGTIGGGNHFVEIQRVAEVLDRRKAWEWGVRAGRMAFMIHSGSRLLGKSIGDVWRRRVTNAWPADTPRPSILSLSEGCPELERYLAAERTAANYGFLNRLALAEIMRRRLREVFGDLECPLVYDLPHNITERRGAGWVTRKGACPAHRDQPVIIPGSMGASSFLMRGLGAPRFLESASHGAGRARSRFELSRRGARWDADTLGLSGVDCITLREERRIEEAPGAYKPIGPVIEAQVSAGLVAPVARLEPVLTFKG